MSNKEKDGELELNLINAQPHYQTSEKTTTQETRPSFFKENFSFFCAASAAFCFAMHNFLVSYSLLHYHKSVTITFGECFAYLAQAIAYYGYKKYKPEEYTPKAPR